MITKMTSSGILTTDPLGKSAGLNFDGANFKTIDANGALANLQVKEAAESTEAVQFSQLKTSGSLAYAENTANKLQFDVARPTITLVPTTSSPGHITVNESVGLSAYASQLATEYNKNVQECIYCIILDATALAFSTWTDDTIYHYTAINFPKPSNIRFLSNTYFELPSALIDYDYSNDDAICVWFVPLAANFGSAFTVRLTIPTVKKFPIGNYTTDITINAYLGMLYVK